MTERGPFTFRRLQELLLCGLLALLLAGCSTAEKVWPFKKVDYRQAREEKPLEVPPGLDTSRIEDAYPIPGTTYSEYERGSEAAATPAGSRVLPTPKGIQVVREGDKMWLRIEAPPEVVWRKVHDFWLQNGFVLVIDDPQLGIMETEWAENRAEIPQDIIRRTLGKVLDSLYSAATRDKFRVRIERGDRPGVTELFLTHRGVEEVVTGNPDEDTGTFWKPRPSDPELEAEMLHRLMVYLGMSEQEARKRLARGKPPAPRARFLRTPDGDMSLVVDEGFSRAWRHTGIALDRVGFAVEDRDRAAGVYYVRYRDPLASQPNRGLLSRLAFWRKESPKEAPLYRIRLESDGAHTRIRVLDAEGRPEHSGTAQRILKLLEEQLK